MSDERWKLGLAVDKRPNYRERLIYGPIQERALTQDEYQELQRQLSEVQERLALREYLRVTTPGYNGVIVLGDPEAGGEP